MCLFLKNVLILKVQAYFVLEIECVSEEQQLEYGPPKKKG